MRLLALAGLLALSVVGCGSGSGGSGSSQTYVVNGLPLVGSACQYLATAPSGRLHDGVCVGNDQKIERLIRAQHFKSSGGGLHMPWLCLQASSHVKQESRVNLSLPPPPAGQPRPVPAPEPVRYFDHVVKARLVISADSEQAPACK
jgi:hypothetical protein